MGDYIKFKFKNEIKQKWFEILKINFFVVKYNFFWLEMEYYFI